MDADDVEARAGKAVEPSLRDGGGLTAVGEAVRTQDRQSAAEVLVPVFEDLRRSADDGLLAGLSEAIAAMATATI